MSKRQELEAEINKYDERIADAKRRKDAAVLELAALPPEPVRLRAVEHNINTIFFAGKDSLTKDHVAAIYSSELSRHDIDPAALAAHICTFGQPAPEATPAREMESLRGLEKSVRKWWDDHGCVGTFDEEQKLKDALTALDAARGVTV